MTGAGVRPAPFTGEAKMKVVQTITLLSCLFLLYSISAAAEGTKPRISLSAGAEYTTGAYGGDTDIEDFYVPITAVADFRKVEFRLTVPYLSVRAPEGTVVIGPGGDPIPGTGEIVTNSGLGDVVGSVTILDVLSNSDLGFAMDLTGKVKFGSADEDKGLGTGENDYTVIADFFRFADRLTLIGSLGYTLRGEPAGVDFDDTLLASVGGIYGLAPTISSGVFFGYRESSIGDDPIEELSVFVSGRVGAGWRTQVYAFTGFSDSGPDWGAGLQFRHDL